MRLIEARLLWCVLAVSWVTTVGCGDETAPAPMRAPADAVPETVALSAASGTEGTIASPRSRIVSIGPLRISRVPTTVSQYRRCVDAGACEPPSATAGTCATSHGLGGATYAEGPERDNIPVTCVTPKQAAAFCGWVGGRMPSPAEWLIAARGPQVHRYAWGDDPATCDRAARTDWRASSCCSGEGCGSLAWASVGAHPNGASPSGVNDVLLTRSEMVAADPQTVFTSCRGGAACLITGLQPNAVDHVVAYANDPVAAVPDALAAAFRCVWDGGAP